MDYVWLLSFALAVVSGTTAVVGRRRRAGLLCLVLACVAVFTDRHMAPPYAGLAGLVLSVLVGLAVLLRRLHPRRWLWLACFGLAYLVGLPRVIPELELLQPFAALLLCLAGFLTGFLWRRSPPVPASIAGPPSPRRRHPAVRGVLWGLLSVAMFVGVLWWRVVDDMFGGIPTHAIWSRDGRLTFYLLDDGMFDALTGVYGRCGVWRGERLWTGDVPPGDFFYGGMTLELGPHRLRGAVVDGCPRAWIDGVPAEVTDLYPWRPDLPRWRRGTIGESCRTPAR